MKILFIGPRFHTNLNDRIKALRDHGHEIKFLSQYKGSIEKYNIISPVVIESSIIYSFLEKVREIIYGNNPKDLWKLNLAYPKLKVLKDEITSYHPDIIIVKGMKSLLSLFSLYFAKKYKIRSFFLVQIDNYYNKGIVNKFFLFIIKKILKTEKIISEIKYKEDKENDFFSFIPFSVETYDFEKKYFKDNLINIVSVGKFVKRKGHLTMLEAINKIKNNFSISLTIIGQKVDSSVFEEINNYIVDNGLEDIVNIVYDIDNNKVFDIYKNSDLFVLPSYNEPAAYSILEAMSCKLPVISSDENGTSFMVEDGVNGFIFRSKNYIDLSQKIINIIKDKQGLIYMGQNSFKIARDKYSNDIFVKKFNLLIKNKNEKNLF